MFSFACTHARKNSASSFVSAPVATRSFDRHLVGAELPDGDRRALRRDRRDDHVDARAVGQTRVDHRRRLVDAAAERRDDALDDAHDVPVVAEAHASSGTAAFLLVEDRVRVRSPSLPRSPASRSSGSSGPKPSTSSATAATSSSRVVPTMPGISCAMSVRAACSTASRALSLPSPSSLFGSSSSISRWCSVNFSSLSATTFCESCPVARSP